MATNIVGATGIDKVQDGIIVNADIDTVAASKLTGALPAISAANLTSIPAANITGTLPAISGANLTGVAPTKSTVEALGIDVPAANLTGTVADARFPATLPAASAANLTSIPAANITGTLPAISGANLTSIPAAEITGSLDYGYKNTPAFLAYSTTANGQNVPTSTWTKIVHPTEAFDSDGKFASGTFTPTVAGQYVLTGMVEMSQTDNNTTLYLQIYKNGSPITGGRWFNYHPDGGGGGPNTSHQISIMVISDTNDYFDLYMYQNSGGRGVQNTFGTYCSHFSGYKLAGA